MSDSSESSSSSEGRITTRIKGPLLGVLAFLVSFPVLWFNEADVATQKAALAEMSKAVAQARAERPKPSHDDQAVHVTGKITASQKIGDPPYLVAGPWLVLDRRVDMYQWIEDQVDESEWEGENLVVTTTYSYRKGWAEGRLDSASFHVAQGHENPTLPIAATALHAPQTKLGQFDADEVIKNILERTPLPLDESMLHSLDKKLPGLSAPLLAEGQLYFTAKGTPDLEAPTLGDVRISYQVLEPGLYSVIARQKDSKRLVSYAAKNGRENLLVAKGTRAPQAMIKAAKDEATTTAMILRGVGFAMMWFGLVMATSPLRHLLQMIPIFGRPTLTWMFFLSLALAVTLSGTTILLAMMVYNPLILAGVIGLAALAIGWFIVQARKQKAPSVALPSSSSSKAFASNEINSKSNAA